MARQKSIEHMTTEEIHEATNRLTKELTQMENKAKLYRNKARTMARKERTHRLITRGATIEKFIPEFEQLSEEEFAIFMGRAMQSQEFLMLVDITVGMHMDHLLDGSRKMSDEKRGEC